jgi:hypothetical protein
LVNGSSSIAIDWKIHEEVWTGYSCIWIIFGCDAYALNSKDQHSKLDVGSNKYIFVGYHDGVMGYRLWDPTVHKIIIRRYVVFDKSPLIKLDIIEVEMK